MSSRPVLCVVPTVEVNQDRYDELLHKEALLDAIAQMHSKASDYLFRDMVGHMLNTGVSVTAEKTDE